MADYDLKSITADTDGPSADTELLFGAPDQSSGTPKPYSFAGIKTWIKSWIAASDVGLGYGSPRNRFYAFTDCIIATGSGVFSDHWRAGWSGTGAAPSNVAVGSFNAVGIYSLDLGTTTTGQCSLSATGMTGIKLGAGAAKFAARLAIHVLSDGTNTYSTRIGFIDSVSGESIDGCFFRYTDGVNGGKWQAVCRSNNTETAVDTGVTPVVDTFQRFEVQVNAAGTSVAFFIDGVQVGGAVTTNIPTGAGRETGYGVMSLKSAGTTATSGCYLDYAEVEYLFTAARQ